MRRVIGYTPTGQTLWSENVEGSAILYRGGIHGTLVSGDHGPMERHRQHTAKSKLTANQRKLDDRPIENGRPRLSPDVERVGRGRSYASEEERTAARRAGWREYSRRSRQKASAA